MIAIVALSSCCLVVVLFAAFVAFYFFFFFARLDFEFLLKLLSMCRRVTAIAFWPKERILETSVKVTHIFRQLA